MMLRVLTSALLLAGILLSAPGCTLSGAGASAIPVAFNTPPALPQVIDAINSNSERVQQLHSDNVRLSIPGQIGGLNATMTYEKSPTPHLTPGRFRLSGEALGSRQLDLGSNDNRYWMWVKQNKPPTVFWGEHSRYHRSAAQQILPMPPSWIVEALGVVTLDPGGVHEGPFQSQYGTPGLFQIRSQVPTPNGNLTRLLEIDESRALIVQQQIYDSSGRLLAVADLSNFNHDALQGVTLPRSIQIKLPPAGLAFNFEVDSYTLNQPVADPELRWAMPQLDGHQYRDLANPNDMQGINLMGRSASDVYDTRNAVREPIRPESRRTAWHRLPAFGFLR